MRNVERFCNFQRAFIAILELERWCSPGHKELRHLPQSCDQFVHYPIGKKSMVIRLCSWFERQYGNSRLSGFSFCNLFGNGRSYRPGIEQAGVHGQVLAILQSCQCVGYGSLQSLLCLPSMVGNPFLKFITKLHLVEQRLCTDDGQQLGCFAALFFGEIGVQPFKVTSDCARL